MTKKEIINELRIMDGIAEDLETALDRLADLIGDYHSSINYLIDRIKND